MSAVELAWGITSYASIFAVILLTGICMSLFVRPYLAKERMAWTVGLTYCAAMAVLYIVPFRVNNFAAYSLGVLAAGIVMWAVDRQGVEQKVFLAGTFFSLRWLSIAMAGRIYNGLYVVAVTHDGVSQRPWIQYAAYLGAKVIYVGASLFFIVAAIWILNRAFAFRRKNLAWTETLMLLMPSAVAMTGYGVLQFYQYIYERDTGGTLTGANGAYDVLSFLHYLVSLVSIFAMAAMFQKARAAQEAEAEGRLLQSQSDDLKKHITRMEELYNDMRLLRHDMGNHMQTIERLLESGDQGAAFQYARHLGGEWNEADSVVRTGNPVTDIILTEKKKAAENGGITFYSGFQYPDKGGIDAFDISAILNNALDNAIEAASGEKPFVRVSSRREKIVFLITVENSFSGTLVTDGDTGIPSSAKGGSGHGLGLCSIRKVARSYLGDIVLEQKGETVVLTVMLKLDTSK